MRMPSLFRYFAVVGSALLALLYGINYLVGPAAVDKAKAVALAPKAAVQHDPRASAVERWRNELAAMQAATQQQTADNASTASKSAPEPAQPVPTALKTPEPVTDAAQPAVAAAQPAVETSPAALSNPQDDEAAKLAARKAKAAKIKAVKTKLARERAAATRLAAGDGGVPVAGYYGASRERTASSQQDQYYYGQRAASLQPAQSPSNAYAPRQSFGPFGFGRGW